MDVVSKAASNCLTIYIPVDHSRNTLYHGICYAIETDQFLM